MPMSEGQMESRKRVNRVGQLLLCAIADAQSEMPGLTSAEVAIALADRMAWVCGQMSDDEPVPEAGG